MLLFLFFLPPFLLCFYSQENVPKCWNRLVSCMSIWTINSNKQEAHGGPCLRLATCFSPTHSSSILLLVTLTSTAHTLLQKCGVCGGWHRDPSLSNTEEGTWYEIKLFWKEETVQSKCDGDGDSRWKDHIL